MMNHMSDIPLATSSPHLSSSQNRGSAVLTSSTLNSENSSRRSRPSATSASLSTHPNGLSLDSLKQLKEKYLGDRKQKSETSGGNKK